MNHLKVFDTLDFLLDKEGAPWHDGFGKEYLVYNGSLEWIRLHAKEFEKTEKRRQDLDLILVRKKVFNPGSAIIDLSTVTKFFLPLGLSGKWNFICQSKITEREIPIRPVSHDELKEIANDPFNQPTDAFPRYEQYHDGTKSVMKIHSDNVPNNVELVYIKDPERVLASSPNANCELPDWTMHEILQHSVRVALGLVENIPRYQAQTQVEIPATG